MKPSPSYKNRPYSMNPEAEHIWRRVLSRYSTDIYSPKSLVDQWKAAKSHFERVCAIENIAPYDTLTAMVVRLDRIARSL